MRTADVRLHRIINIQAEIGKLTTAVSHLNIEVNRLYHLEKDANKNLTFDTSKSETEEQPTKPREFVRGDHVIATTKPHKGVTGVIIATTDYSVRILPDNDSKPYHKAKHLIGGNT